MFQDEEEEFVIKGTPVVPFHLSKKLSSIEGTDTIYFIDKNRDYEILTTDSISILSLQLYWPQKNQL